MNLNGFLLILIGNTATFSETILVFLEFFQHHIDTIVTALFGYVPEMRKNSFTLFPLLSAVLLSLFCTNASAQVSITLGVQTVYDDNVFLEDTKPPPVPMLFNDDLIEQSSGGTPRRLVFENFDGKPNSDFLTNITAGAAGSLPFLQQTIDSSYDFTAGVILFNKYSEQDRLILDGELETSLADIILPGPYHFTIRNGIHSTSNNVSAPSSTATQTTQNYILSGETGIRNVEISRDLTYDLGYIGSYQKFLGEFSLNDVRNRPSLVRQGGIDFHSHMGDSALNYKVNDSLTLGIVGTGGVQIFTAIDPGDFGDVDLDPSQLDRINGEVQGTVKYTYSKTLSMNAAVGMGYSKLKNTPLPIEVITTNPDGTTTSEFRDPQTSNTGLTYLLSINYAYRPGSLLTLGGSQGFTTNIDGQRFINRVTFINLSEPLMDDLKLVLGGSYLQFEDESELSPNISRFEGTASLNYHIGQATALTFGYNYTVQSTKSSGAMQERGIPVQDLQSNRIFIGITTGFVGLPL